MRDNEPSHKLSADLQGVLERLGKTNDSENNWAIASFVAGLGDWLIKVSLQCIGLYVAFHFITKYW